MLPGWSGGCQDIAAGLSQGLIPERRWQMQQRRQTLETFPVLLLRRNGLDGRFDYLDFLVTYVQRPARSWLLWRYRKPEGRFVRPPRGIIHPEQSRSTPRFEKVGMHHKLGGTDQYPDSTLLSVLRPSHKNSELCDNAHVSTAWRTLVRVEAPSSPAL